MSLPVFVGPMPMPEYMLRGFSLCLAPKQLLHALSSRVKRAAGLLYVSEPCLRLVGAFGRHVLIFGCSRAAKANLICC